VFAKLGMETHTSAAGLVMSRIRALQPQFESSVKHHFGLQRPWSMRRQLSNLQQFRREASCQTRPQTPGTFWHHQAMSYLDMP
jgi:hypothetical protein